MKKIFKQFLDKISSISNPNSLYKNITALQSALCSDQSHFSWFECYPKKDTVKHILISFRYSAKTNKSRSFAVRDFFIVIYFIDKESIKSISKKATLVYNLTFCGMKPWGRVILVFCRLLLHRPNSCDSVWHFDQNKKKRKTKVIKSSWNNLHKYGVLIVLVESYWLVEYLKFCIVSQ